MIFKPRSISLKGFFLLAALAGLMATPWACSSNNNPTQPSASTATPVPFTPTATTPPCVNATTGFTCTFTPTDTMTVTSTSTATVSPTPTVNVPIHWAACGIDQANGSRTANLYLQVNGSPETTAGVTLISAAAGVTVAVPYQSYYAGYNASYYSVSGFNYQAGATYVILTATSAGTASATLLAPGGGVTVSLDGSTASWNVEGNNDVVDVYPPGGGSFTYGPDLVSPYSIPASAYSAPGTYQVDVIAQKTGTVTGALAVNAPEMSDYWTFHVCPSCPTNTPTWTFTSTFTPTNTKTVTPTFTKTPTPTATDSPTATATNSPTSTATPTPCSTRSSFGNVLTTSVSYDAGDEFGATQYAFPGGRLQGLSVNLLNANGQVRLAIYTDNGSSAPQSLVAQAGPVSAVAGVNSIDLALPIDLTAGNYWLAFQISNTNAGVQAFTTTPAGVSGSTTFGPFPANFSGLGSYTSGVGNHFGLNGTYCP